MKLLHISIIFDLASCRHVIKQVQKPCALFPEIAAMLELATQFPARGAEIDAK